MLEYVAGAVVSVICVIVGYAMGAASKKDS